VERMPCSKVQGGRLSADSVQSLLAKHVRVAGESCPPLTSGVTALLARLPDHPASRIAELSPWNWKAARFARSLIMQNHGPVPPAVYAFGVGRR
jgi:hypothetical protein